MKYLNFRLLLIILLTLLLSTMVGCKKDEEDDEFDDDFIEDSDDEVSIPGLNSTCGIVRNQSITTGRTSGVIPVQVRSIIKPDLVVVRRITDSGTSGDELIQLLGVTSDGVSTFLQNLGEEIVDDETSNGAYLVLPGQCPVIVTGGGQGLLGQLFSDLGDNIAEILLEEGSVIPSDNGCGASNLLGCYDSIEVEEQFSTQTVTTFLWKPVSESNGNLVVLIDPFNVRVVVNGSSLTDFGPSNGRGTTARGNRPGCAYGSNVRVEFFDSLGRRVLLSNGQGSVTISNGCNRVDTRF